MRQIIALFMTAALLWLATPAARAQDFPDHQRLTVNDYADLLSDAAEAQIHEQLSALRRDRGTEMTVLTLPTQSAYAPGMDLETFATALFNDWGIGDASRSDGVLILVLRDDRAMRIELGAGFARDWDGAAQRIIDRSFLPAFREDRFEDGILAGTQDTIDTIVTPFLDGTAPTGESGETVSWLMIALFAMTGAALHFRRRLGDLLTRLRRCPQCGARTLTRRSTTLVSATRQLPGQGRAVTLCSSCDFREENAYTIPRLGKSSSSSGFGGGRSGGGGASGRW